MAIRTRTGAGMSADRLRFSANTHVGHVRKLNEDSILALPDQNIWVVSDGMGGHAAGDYASQMVVDCVAMLSPDLAPAAKMQGMRDAIHRAHAAIRSEAEARGGVTIGATVVSLVISNGHFAALWAGDSRLYRKRGRQMQQITRDHNPIVDQLDSGVISEEEALATDTNVITRAVGGQHDLHLDVAVFDVCPGDTMLLCSDGLYREVEAQDIFDALQQDVDEAVERLMHDCLQGAARDNVSIVVARAGDLQ